MPSVDLQVAPIDLLVLRLQQQDAPRRTESNVPLYVGEQLPQRSHLLTWDRSAPPKD